MQATFVTDSFRTVVGVKGDFGDAWKCDVYAQRGTVDNNNGNKNYFSNANINNALNVIPDPVHRRPGVRFRRDRRACPGTSGCRTA